MFSPINLLLDFLFIEILSAPTVDSVKVAEELSLIKSDVRRVAMRANEEDMSQAIIASKLSKKKLERNSSMKTCLEIHGAAADAHMLALTTSKSVLDAAREGNKKVDSFRETPRYKSMLRKQQDSARMKQEKKAKMIEGRQEGESQSAKTLDSRSASVIDDLFVNLTLDIAEQRKLLPRGQHENFDDKWG
jgi:vacuolar-type H+-ATPase subunit E/Vma4